MQLGMISIFLTRERRRADIPREDGGDGALLVLHLGQALQFGQERIHLSDQPHSLAYGCVGTKRGASYRNNHLENKL